MKRVANRLGFTVGPIVILYGDVGILKTELPCFGTGCARVVRVQVKVTTTRSPLTDARAGRFPIALVSLANSVAAVPTTGGAVSVAERVTIPSSEASATQGEQAERTAVLSRLGVSTWGRALEN